MTIKQRSFQANPWAYHTRQDGLRTGQQNWADVHNIPPRYKPELTVREAAWMIVAAFAVGCAVSGFARFCVAVADWIGGM